MCVFTQAKWHPWRSEQCWSQKSEGKKLPVWRQMKWHITVCWTPWLVQPSMKSQWAVMRLRNRESNQDWTQNKQQPQIHYLGHSKQSWRQRRGENTLLSEHWEKDIMAMVGEAMSNLTQSVMSQWVVKNSQQNQSWRQLECHWGYFTGKGTVVRLETGR